MSTASLITQYPIPLSLYHLVEALTLPLDDRERRFFVHVLASSLATSRIGDPWHHGIELPSRTIDKLFGTRLSPKELADRRLLAISSYSTDQRRCKSYRIHPRLIPYVVRALDAAGLPIVNLIDGSSIEGLCGFQRCDRVVENAFLRQAVDRLRRCPFDARELEAHIEASRVAAFASGNKEARLLRRLMNDLGCSARLRGGSQAGADVIREYQPAYRLTFSGRLSEIGGGLMNATREMKYAALGGLANVHNYDLRSSQAFALLQDLQHANLECRWLARLLANPLAMNGIAESLGLSRDVVKECFYSIVMGAEFTRYADPRLTLFGKLLDAMGGDEMAAKAKLDELHKTFRPLEKIRDAWHEWLVSSDECHHLVENAAKRMLQNDCGLRLVLDEIPKHRQKRRAAAFILQGREAAYIHHLTLLADKYGYEPVSNQHDGLVTVGEIPQAAREEAKNCSGFRYADLVEKPFTPPLPQSAPTAACRTLARCSPGEQALDSQSRPRAA